MSDCGKRPSKPAARFHAPHDRWGVAAWLRARVAALALGMQDGEPEGVTLSPVVTLSARAETVRALPGVQSAALGLLIDNDVLPGIVRITLHATVVEPDNTTVSGTAERVAIYDVPVVVIDLMALPGASGTVGDVRVADRFAAQAHDLLAALGRLGGEAGWRWESAGEGGPDAAAASPASPKAEGRDGKDGRPSLPKRPAYRRRWVAAWHVAKPLVAAGKGDVAIGYALRRQGLPHDPRVVRAIIAAGQAGLLDGV